MGASTRGRTDICRSLDRLLRSRGGGSSHRSQGCSSLTDLATLTAILYAAKLQRRVPETESEKRGTIAVSLADAKLIVAAVIEDDSPPMVAEPEQPPPPPGTIGRIAEVKAPRRRG